MATFDREELNALVRERAESDKNFRVLLLADPAAAMAGLIGISVPDGVNLTVHEETPTDIHLVISAERGLSDMDLDLVSGGTEWNFPNTGPITCGCA